MFDAECATRSDEERPSDRDNVNYAPKDPQPARGLAG
jgi:hypothetical protein